MLRWSFLSHIVTIPTSQERGRDPGPDGSLGLRQNDGGSRSWPARSAGPSSTPTISIRRPTSKRCAVAFRSPMRTACRGSTRCATASSRPTSAGENIVLACSALKHAYQHYLEQYAPESVHYVLLVGSEEQIRQRLGRAQGPFHEPELLHSQFETLEAPEHALSIDIALRRRRWRTKFAKSLQYEERGHRLTAAENAALLRARLSSHGPRRYTAREFRGTILRTGCPEPVVSQGGPRNPQLLPQPRAIPTARRGRVTARPQIAPRPRGRPPGGPFRGAY